MSRLHEDFVASHIRSQIVKLRNLVNNLEHESGFENGYLSKNLRDVELSLRQLRKIVED
jgi:hypothetical protein